MAVGFVDGCIALFKGDLSRDRNSKPKMLKELGQGITGMAFKCVSKDQWYLFVSTASSVQQFNVTSKDSCPMVYLLVIITLIISYMTLGDFNFKMHYFRPFWMQ